MTDTMTDPRATASTGTANAGGQATPLDRPAPAARPTKKVELGVNITLSSDPTKIEADMALAASLGFRWVRTSQEMHWAPDGRISVLGVYAETANAYGLRLIQCCQGMPASLARGGLNGHYGAKDARSAAIWGEWFAHCASMVQTTGGATSCLNEPDNFGWDATPSASDCAILHAAALEARDRLAPHTTFVTAEMAPGNAPDPLEFLKAIVTIAPQILTDDHVWIGWHPYTDPRWTANYAATWNACYRMREVDLWVKTRPVLGAVRKKIMGGEWAIANGPPGNVRALSPVGVAYVRDSYLPAFDAMAADGLRLGPLLWYTLRDRVPPADKRADSWANYCGVVDVAGKPKPVAAVLRAYNERAA